MANVERRELATTKAARSVVDTQTRSRGGGAMKRRLKSRRRGRPRGSRVPLERDRQRFAVAVWWGLHEMGYGPYEAAYLASTAVGDGPIRLESVENVLTIASTNVKHTSASLDEHIHALVRKAKRAPASDWLVTSVRRSGPSSGTSATMISHAPAPCSMS